LDTYLNVATSAAYIASDGISRHLFFEIQIGV
jgi:hypothetical protein